MKISYHITREDYIDAQKLHRSKSPRAFVRAMVVVGKVLAGAGFLTLLVLAAVVRDRKLWSDLAPLIILLILWALAMLVWVPFHWRRSYAKDRRLQQQITADISEEGIRGKCGLRLEPEVGALLPFPGVRPDFSFVPDKSNVQFVSQGFFCPGRD